MSDEKIPEIDPPPFDSHDFTQPNPYGDRTYTFSRDDPTNTTIYGPDRRPAYLVETPDVLFRRGASTIKRLTHAQPAEEVGHIAYHTTKPSIINVHEKEVHMDRGFWTDSVTFTASNGRSYKWRTKNRGYQLFTHDRRSASPAAAGPSSGTSTPSLKGTMVAHFDRHNDGITDSRHPATLFLASEVVSIADDVVTTLCYAETEWRRRSSEAAVMKTM